MSTHKTVYNKLFSKQELSAEKVELALAQDLIKDAEIAQGKLKALINIVSKREYDFRELEKKANELGIQLDSKLIQAGKFFRDLEQKLS
jgi:cell division GTPase FtsZ